MIARALKLMKPFKITSDELGIFHEWQGDCLGEYDRENPYSFLCGCGVIELYFKDHTEELIVSIEGACDEMILLLFTQWT